MAAPRATGMKGIGLRIVIGVAAMVAGIGLSSSAPAQTPGDDAILSGDFDASLPPLDQTAAPPAPMPEPAPPADPELAAPLPPLASFDPTPATTAAAVRQGDAPAAIPYTVVVKGLKEVDLDAPFRDLSALLQDKRKAANAAQVAARAEEDEKLAGRLLRAQGYYDGVVTSAVDTLPNAANNLTVTISATPGPRYLLDGVAVTGAAPEPERLALDALALKKGDPLVAATIESAEARVALRLPEQGYPFATVGQRDVLLDERDHSADYSLPVTAGAKSRFGGLRTEGDPVFTVDHIALLPRFDAGDLYDSRQVDDLRQALIATGLLSTVAVEPVATGRANPDGTEIVDLLVRQTAGPARRLAASAGYGTGEGIKLTGSWTHRNLFPQEGALTVEGVAGTRQQSLATTFRRSNAGQRDRTFSLGASVARQDFEAFNAQTISLTGSLARASTPIFQKRWTWSIGGELIASRETRFVPALGERPRSTYFIAALPAQLGFDSSNSLLDPTRGFRLTARVSPEAQKRNGGGSDVYARLLGEGSAYYPVLDSLVLAGRARVGSILGASRDSIAPSRRYYAGGGGSVRGFGFQQLGPKDADNNPVGGRSLTEFAIEARYRFGDYGIVPFLDAGRVGEGSTPSLSGMRYGVGLGGRYYTNFGPMRIDVAMPLNRRPGESKVALYLSIGQAF